MGDPLNLNQGAELNLNHGAYAVVRQMARQAGNLGVAVSRLPGGAVVIDCGVQAQGGYAAGLLFAAACMGGLGQVCLAPWQAEELHLPGVQVCTDRPWAACMASQHAGWSVNSGQFSAMGAGPARALAKVERLFEHLPVEEPIEVAVLALETRELPTEAVAAELADACGIEQANLALLIAPTASVVGSVQVSARVVETALYKLHEQGFDVTRVRAAWGTAPVAPVSADDLRAVRRTNDCIRYGGRVTFTVDASDDELQELVAAVPASGSPELWLTGCSSGRTFHGGRVDAAMLQQSLFGGASESKSRWRFAGAVPVRLAERLRTATTVGTEVTLSE